MFLFVTLLAFLIDLTIKVYLVHYNTLDIVENSGISWGLGSGFFAGSLARIIPFLLGIAIFSWLYFRGFDKRLELLKKDNKNLDLLYTIGGGMVFGGGVGNFIDRIVYFYVVDYISVFNLITMNVADIFIIVGTLLVLISILRAGRLEDAKKT